MGTVVTHANSGELVAEGQCLPQYAEIVDLPEILQEGFHGQMKRREISSAAMELNVEKLLKGCFHVVVPKALSTGREKVQCLKTAKATRRPRNPRRTRLSFSTTTSTVVLVFVAAVAKR